MLAPIVSATQEDDEAAASTQHETPVKKGKDEDGEAYEQVGGATKEQISMFSGLS